MADNLTLLSTQAAADYLGLVKGTLENWRTAGLGPPYIRVGPRAIRYKLSDLDAWLEQGRVRP